MNAAMKPAPIFTKRTAGQFIRVMGLPFLDCSLDDATSLITEAALAKRQQNIFFVNAHCVNVAARDDEYRNILCDEEFLFADGAGMELAALIEGQKLNHNVNGTDLFPVICAAAAAKGIRVALLGASPGIAQACADNMTQELPGLEIVSVHDGYLQADDERLAIDAINASGADILFVAKGVPMQEHWIRVHRSKLQTPVILGVGALFDFYSGAVPRAPKLWRRLRAEWAYRLLREPRRMFRRYILGNPEFLLRALWMRVSGYAD